MGFPTLETLPTEIWLEISPHLTLRDMRRLAILNRTLNCPFWRNDLGASKRIRVRDIVKRLEDRVYSGGAMLTKQLIFLETSSRPTLKPPNLVGTMVYTMNKWIHSPAVRIDMANLSQYQNYPFVNSLAFLMHTGTASICSRLSMPILWQTFSTHLRELSISLSRIDGLSSLRLPRSSHPLPCLEVMRFAYMNTCSDNEENPSPFLPRLAALYTNQALLELEIRFIYPNPHCHSGPWIVRHLLPEDHVFPLLRRFWIVTERKQRNVPDEGLRIVSFVQAHGHTLKCIKVHWFRGFIRPMFWNPPSYSTPVFSLAFQDLNPTHGLKSGLAPQSIYRDNLVELELYGHLESPDQVTFPQLRRLKAHRENFGLEKFPIYAICLPQLLSLSIKYETCFVDPLDVRNHPLSTNLSEWKLRDLSLEKSCTEGKPSLDYPLMRAVATHLIPTVESFGGKGDMLERHESWEEAWGWERNVYIDPLLGLGGSAAGCPL
ncbi:hypothetical protein DL96DRAFT_1817538 [Flagelloscypha sp. PMI_526]|nr:hypothetical protein DL96DRAFT_1817538 [Flagelloscypha sp. PMI_526]